MKGGRVIEGMGVEDERTCHSFFFIFPVIHNPIELHNPINNITISNYVTIVLVNVPPRPPSQHSPPSQRPSPAHEGAVIGSS